MTGGYVLAVGPVEYHTTKQGDPITLAEMLRWAHGVAGCDLYRADGTLVARNIGSAEGFTHEPTGTRVRRGHAHSWPVRRMAGALRRRSRDLGEHDAALALALGIRAADYARAA